MGAIPCSSLAHRPAAAARLPCTIQRRHPLPTSIVYLYSLEPMKPVPPPQLRRSAEKLIDLRGVNINKHLPILLPFARPLPRLVAVEWDRRVVKGEVVRLGTCSGLRSDGRWRRREYIGRVVVRIPLTCSCFYLKIPFSSHGTVIVVVSGWEI